MKRKRESGNGEESGEDSGEKQKCKRSKKGMMSEVEKKREEDYERNRKKFTQERWETLKKTEGNEFLVLHRRNGKPPTWYCSLCPVPEGKNPHEFENFSSKSVSEHRSSGKHAAAVENRKKFGNVMMMFNESKRKTLSSSDSNLPERAVKLGKKIDEISGESIVCIARLILRCFWIIKECLAFIKIESLCEEDVLMCDPFATLGKYANDDGFLKVLGLLFTFFKRETVLELIRGVIFTSSTDGTTDLCVKKKFIVLVSYLDRRCVKQTRFFRLFDLPHQKADEVASAICSAFEEEELNMEKGYCGGSMDGENTNFGVHNSVKTHLEAKYALAEFEKCVAHTNDLGFRKADDLTIVVELDDFLEEVRNVFKFPSRFELLEKAAQKLMEKLTTLKRSQTTRWLSKGKSIEAVVQDIFIILEAIQSALFNDDFSKIHKKLKRLESFILKLENILFLMFMRDVANIQISISSNLQERHISYGSFFSAICSALAQLDSLRLSVSEDGEIVYEENSCFGQFMHDRYGRDEGQVSPFLKYRSKNREGVMRDVEVLLSLGDYSNLREANVSFVQKANEFLDTVTEDLHTRFDSLLNGKKYKAFDFLDLENYKLDNTSWSEESLNALFSLLDVKNRFDILGINRSTFRGEMKRLVVEVKTTPKLCLAEDISSFLANFPKHFSSAKTALSYLLIRNFSSVEPERAFSLLGRIKTKLRNAISTLHLEQCMLVCLNAPSLFDFSRTYLRSIILLFLDSTTQIKSINMMWDRNGAFNPKEIPTFLELASVVLPFSFVESKVTQYGSDKMKTWLRGGAEELESMGLLGKSTE